MIGHTLGAAGGVEAVATVLQLTRGTLHPTINYETPDPDCDLDYIPNQARHADVDVAMSNSFGFGGQNAVLVFKRYQVSSRRRMMKWTAEAEANAAMVPRRYPDTRQASRPNFDRLVPFAASSNGR